MSAYVVAERVGAVEVSGCVYVARLPDGPIIELRGTAALIWRETLAGSIDGIAGRVAEATGLPVEEVAADVEHFVESLRERGLIVVAPGARY